MREPRAIVRGVAAFAAACLLLVAEPRPGARQTGTAAASDVVTLSIVGTNDLHGGLAPASGGGLAWLGGYLANLRAARARDGGAVVLVDAGDMFQGTLESNLGEGEAVIAAYNVLGYAAAAVGNHEFDFGPVGPAATPSAPGDDPRGALKARAADAHFPFLAANLIDQATGHPVSWRNVMPSTVTTAAGVRVGIVGVMTRAALSATTAANTHGLAVAPLTPAITREAQALRAAGVDVVIVAAHAGGRCARFDRPDDVSSCDAKTSEIADVARHLPVGLVDAIIAGHTHAGMAHEFAAIPISEAYANGRAFGRIDLTLNRQTHRVVGHRNFPPRNLRAGEYEGAPVTKDAAIERVLAPVLARVRDLKQQPIPIVFDTTIPRAGTPESPLGNLFTDALLSASPGADVAINNTAGGLRADVPAGPLTYGALFETFPFDNRLVSASMSGADLRRMFAAALRSSRPLPGIAGLYVEGACVGTRLDVVMRRPTGAIVRDDETVHVATTDFLVSGGDGIFSSVTPPQGLAITDGGSQARDAVRAWLTQRGGHLTAAQLVDTAHPRWTYHGALPLRCSSARQSTSGGRTSIIVR